MKTPIERKAVLEYLVLEKKQLLEKVAAIDNALIGLGEPMPHVIRQAARITPQLVDLSNYKQTFTWKEKIVCALSKIGNGSVQDITDVLKEVDSIDEKIIRRAVTVNTSALNISGFLSDDGGRPRKYQLKSPE